MTFSAWISFALLTAIQTASPGPAVSLLISTGLRSGISGALALLPGILVGVVVRLFRHLERHVMRHRQHSSVKDTVLRSDESCERPFITRQVS